MILTKFLIDQNQVMLNAEILEQTLCIDFKETMEHFDVLIHFQDVG